MNGKRKVLRMELEGFLALARFVTHLDHVLRPFLGEPIVYSSQNKEGSGHGLRRNDPGIRQMTISMHCAA